METCNIKEAGAILGCCRHHVLKLIRTGKIPASIVGRSWRFVKEDLLNYIRKGDTVAAGSRCSESSMEEPKHGN